MTDRWEAPDHATLLGVLRKAADAVTAALAGETRRELAGTTPGQYRSDLAADQAAVAVLTGAGLGVLSEESGRHHPDRAVTVVVDPLDGSTNAFRQISWYATSLCAVDADGPLACIVVDLTRQTIYEAVRGGGVRRNGVPIGPSGVEHLRESIVGLNGLPDRHLGWNQYRALGAAALDLCAVADGRLDGFVDCTDDGLAPWDYLGGALVCAEAGASVIDLLDRPLLDLDHRARRTVVAGGTPALVTALATARRGSGPAAVP